MCTYFCAKWAGARDELSIKWRQLTFNDYLENIIRINPDYATVMIGSEDWGPGEAPFF